MIYAYPKLDGINFGLFRKGGCGLGNLLFTYARAYVWANKHNARLIWPTWSSFNPSVVFSKERDKRFYNDLFKNAEGAIYGIEKIRLFLKNRKVPEVLAINMLDDQLDECIVIFEGMEGCFEPILHDSALVKQGLINCLREKQKVYFDRSYDGVMMHVRLGDFVRATSEQLLNGNHNSSIPIEWYCSILQQLREIVGDIIPCHVVSDGTDDELLPLLKMEKVNRVFCGSSIADIFALSKARLLVASGSSFSMWARYLGRMPVICFPNQLKQRILLEYEGGFELEVLDSIDLDHRELIRQIFR